MKSFLNRILICAIPVVAAMIVCGVALTQYLGGRGGFKLGTDIVGGTILIYEIDATKFPNQAIPTGTAQQLAEKLKKRLDPADTYGITIRAASDSRVEIILPTGGKHQVEEEQRVWKQILAEAEKQYPVQHYTVRYDESGRNIKLLGQVTAQDPKESVALVRDYIDKNAPKERDDQQKWDAFLEEVVKQYPPATYTAGRGNMDMLRAEILQQKGSDIEKNEESLDALRKFLDGETDKVQRQSLTTEGVAEVKQKISHVGSLKFLIAANETKDKDGQEAARKFIEKATGRDEKTRAWKSKQLHDELETFAINGFVPPSFKKDGTKLTCLGEKFDTSDNFSYSWVELSPAFRGERGLSDPRYDNSVPSSATDEKGFGALIGITDKDVERFYNEKLNELDSKALEEQFKDDPKQLEKFRLLRGETLHKSTKLTKPWLDAARARYEGKTFPMSVGRQQSAVCFSREAKSIKAAGKERGKQYEYFLLMRNPNLEAGEPEVTGEYLDSASPNGDKVEFGFRSVGADLFYEFTQHNIEQPMAIVLDGYLRSVANIKSAISSRGYIEFGSNSSQDEINRTVQNLNAGALPASLRPDAVSENTMGPTLGEDTIFWGSISVVVAFVAVLGFMGVYYRFAGLVACVALFANLILTVAFMVAVKATFTLPGLAGLVLMLGMAVDANVLIYERIREERDRGASLALAIRNGYDRAFPTIIDTHLSSIFTAIVLYIVGNDQLKGFGISLTVGLIISLFTSLYLTRTMFDFWLAKGWLKKLSMFRFLTKPNIDFMAIRNYWFTATILLTLVGGAIFIFRLDKGGLNIDFVGGTAYSSALVEPVEIGKLRRMFDPARQEKLLKVKPDSVKALDEKDGKASKFEITYVADGDLYPNDEIVRVELPEPVPTPQLQKRAGLLEDVSVEQYYVGTAEGQGSAYFTVRTAEKAPDLVQVMIDRLMVDKQDGQRKQLLKKILLSDYQVEDRTGKSAILTFTNSSGKPEFASKAQVTRLLGRQIDFSMIDRLRSRRHELEGLKVESETAEAADKQNKIKEVDAEIDRLDLIKQQVELKGIGTDKDGRFQWMELVMTGPLVKENTKESAAQLGTILKNTSEEFQRRPQPERLENFDSQLAKETQTRALYAIVASWAAILLYLWFRFGNWTFGLAAVLCLIHDLFFTLGIIAFCHWLHDIWFFGTVLGLQDFKIDLQTVAALLTLVGYSVSDTIVVFDRIREVRGKNPELTPKTINDSVNQTLSRTLLTAFSVWLVVTVLYFLGGEGVHLFAFVMVIGVVVGTYSSIYIASPLLLIFGEGRRPKGAVIAPRETQPTPAGSAV